MRQGHCVLGLAGLLRLSVPTGAGQGSESKQCQSRCGPGLGGEGRGLSWLHSGLLLAPWCSSQQLTQGPQDQSKPMRGESPCDLGFGG